jgi:Lipocalin-like domain
MRSIRALAARFRMFNLPDMRKMRLFIVLAIVGITACDGDREAKSVKERNQLVGTWRLIEYTDYDSVNHKWTNPYGLHPRGFFTYTSTGIINLNGSAEVPLKVHPDSEYVKPLTLGAVLDNAWGYFGTYTIDSVQSVVIHHVKGGSVINYIGTDQHRQFVIKGDTLFIGDPTFEIGKRVLVRAD